MMVIMPFLYFHKYFSQVDMVTLVHVTGCLVELGHMTRECLLPQLDQIGFTVERFLRQIRQVESQHTSLIDVTSGSIFGVQSSKQLVLWQYQLLQAFYDLHGFMLQIQDNISIFGLWYICRRSDSRDYANREYLSHLEPGHVCVIFTVGNDIILAGQPWAGNMTRRYANRYARLALYMLSQKIFAGDIFCGIKLLLLVRLWCQHEIVPEETVRVCFKEVDYKTRSMYRI